MRADTAARECSTIYAPSSATPASILGALYYSDWDAADPSISILTGKVASVPNRGLDGAAQAQATAGSRPAWSASSFNGGPGMTGNGSSQFLQAVFNAAIAIGKRPYMWIVGQQTVVNPGLTSVFCALSGSGGTPYEILYGSPDGSTPQKWLMHSVSQTDTSGLLATGVNGDTNRHLWEGGFIPTGVNAYLVDGAHAQTSTITSALGAAIVQATMFSFKGTSQFGSHTIRRIIVASDQPSAAQVSQMRSYLRGQAAYGLP